MNHIGFVNHVIVHLHAWWGGNGGGSAETSPCYPVSASGSSPVLCSPSLPWNKIGHCCASKDLSCFLPPVFLDASLYFVVMSDSPVSQCGAMLTRARRKGQWTPCCCTDRVSGVLLCFSHGVGCLSSFLALGLGGKGEGYSQIALTCTHSRGEVTANRPSEATELQSGRWCHHGFFSSRCCHCVQWWADHAFLGD